MPAENFRRDQALRADLPKFVAKALTLAERGEKSGAIEAVRQAATPLTLELMAWSREADA